MKAMLAAPPETGADELEIATFYVDDALMGLPIGQVEEINRHLELTPVPHAPSCVRGLLNLRGEVVTVIDLRTVFGMAATAVGRQSCNVVIRSGSEQIGLLVDRVGDVVRTRWSDVEPAPANVAGADGRFFRGVCKLEEQLLILLDTDQVLSVEDQAGP